MADSSHVVEVNSNETESEQNDSVTISLEKDLPAKNKHDSTDTDKVEITIKDDTSRKKKRSFAVFRMKLVSEVMDTKIVDGSIENTVGQDVSGMQSKLSKNVYDVYQGGGMDYEGEDPDDRNEFVRLVFGICGVMLMVVFVSTMMIYNSPEAIDWMRGTMMGLVVLVVCAILITCISYIYCCSDCSRQAPVNWCLNIIATLCYCYLCGFICARYAPIVVLGALFSTLVVVLVCLGLAYTSFDFTKFILLIMIAMIALMVASLFLMVLKMAFGMKLTFFTMMLTIISAVVSSLLLVIEFQMILGGKSVEMSTDQYVFGAYMIFTSIISMFLKLLRIIAFLAEMTDE